MERSWFARASSRTYDLLQDSTRHELPRWRSPSPMAASIIPPPIVQSTYSESPRAVQRSVIIQPTSPWDDRQRALEADLQFLLDAQAEGLVRGLEGGTQDDLASTGSTTPTVQSVRSASARRSPRPTPRRPGLRSARRGIYNSIRALSDVKCDELASLDADMKENDGALRRIDEWEQKRQKLQMATRSVDESGTKVRAQRVRLAADKLQAEINKARMELEDMEAKHRKLMRQAAALENATQAKMASYTSSLSMLEVEVQKFLSITPASEDFATGPPPQESSIWHIPTKKRTLEMAREYYEHERESVSGQRRNVELEKTALDEGVGLWKDVVAQVTEFEKQLRAEISSMPAPNTALNNSPSDQALPERTHVLLGNLDDVLNSLSDKYKLAEERDWKLLIAAIGAEVDALQQGKRILQDLLGVSTESDHVGDDDEEARAAPDDGDGDEIHELDKSFETARRRGVSESEDDPDPELMFSRRDIESE